MIPGIPLLSLGFFYPMNENLQLMIQSFLIGFTAAATLGPIALICIQRTLRYGQRVGLASGLGVALADGVYGLVGALGLSALTNLLLDNQMVIRLAGGVVLIILGIRAFRSSVEINLDKDAHEQGAQSTFGAAGSIFLLTLSNPVTIMFFSAVYAGLMVGGDGLAGSGAVEFGIFTLGVFTGSFSWWVILVSFISAIRHRFQLGQLAWLNRISGMAITGFGVWVLLDLLF